MEDSYYQNTPIYNSAHNGYWEPQLAPSIHIHPESAAGQLGLTPAELAPILREQQEFLRNESAQPPTRPTAYHHNCAPVDTPAVPPPNPAPLGPPPEIAAYYAQCGYTPADIEELNRECIREQAELLAIEDEAWRVARKEREVRGEQIEGAREKSEERMGQPEEIGEARESEPGKPTRHQLPTPTTYLARETDVYEGYGMSDEPPVVATSHDDDDNPSNRGDVPPAWYQPQPPTCISDARPLLQPLDHDGHNATNDYNGHAPSFEYTHELECGTTSAEPGLHAIGRLTLAQELELLGQGCGDWATEVNEELGIRSLGEYVQTTYSPAPAPPPPAPWYPPQPPTSDYPPPQTHYAPTLNWYNPQRSRYTPRRPHFRPHTRPPPTRHDRFENRTGHVTAVYRNQHRAPTRSNQTGPPRYVPPALRNDHRTFRGSQLPNPRHSTDWRDPPPHRSPSRSTPKRADSPNWREAHPGQPTSFRSPSPPLPKSPTPPPTQTHILKQPRTPPVQTPESQLSRELNSLIKNAAEALRTIVQVSEKLVRQVNAGRRLAHKFQQSSWCLHEDVHGDLACSSPPASPSGRGVSVTGSLADSVALA